MKNRIDRMIFDATTALTELEPADGPCISPAAPAELPKNVRRVRTPHAIRAAAAAAALLLISGGILYSRRAASAPELSPVLPAGTAPLSADTVPRPDTRDRSRLIRSARDIRVEARWLPEGYAVTEQLIREDERSLELVAKNEAEETIRVSVTLADPDGADAPWEPVGGEPATVNGHAAVVTASDGTASVEWYDPEREIIGSAQSADVDGETLLQVAENLDIQTEEPASATPPPEPYMTEDLEEVSPDPTGESLPAAEAESEPEPEPEPEIDMDEIVLDGQEQSSNDDAANNAEEAPPEPVSFEVINSWRFDSKDGKLCGFDAEGNLLTGWQPLSYGGVGKWFYFHSDGSVHSGWLYDDENWYYFDVDEYYMLADETYLTNCGVWRIDGKLYYFAPSGRLIQNGWIGDSVSNTWRYAGADGSLVTGWFEYNDLWYYFDPDSGVCLPSTWRSIDGTRYYFTSSGAMATGWQMINGDWCYFDANGLQHLGWLQYDGAWYYFSLYGMMKNDIMPRGENANGNNPVYYISASGKADDQPYTGWFETGGSRHYYKNGYQQSGWLKLDGKWYYLDPNQGRGMVYSCCKKIGGTPYVFTDSGALSSGGWTFCTRRTIEAGFDMYDNHWYYADTTGVARTGWLQLGSNWYFLCTTTEQNAGYGPLGSMLIGTYTIDGTSYTFDSNGVWQH